MSLISKDEPLRTSMVNVGYWILQALEKAPEQRLSLVELGGKLRKHGVNRARPMTFALIFLHLAGVVEFRAPYVYKLTT